MKSKHLITGIGISAILFVGIISLAIYKLRNDNPTVIILPEEISQANKGDKMQYHYNTKGDTLFLEFRSVKTSEASHEENGEQLVVGDDIKP